MPILPFRRRGRHHGRATFPTPRPRRRVPVSTVVAVLVLAALLAVAAVLIASAVARAAEYAENTTCEGTRIRPSAPSAPSAVAPDLRKRSDGCADGSSATARTVRIPTIGEAAR